MLRKFKAILGGLFLVGLVFGMIAIAKGERHGPIDFVIESEVIAIKKNFRKKGRLRCRVTVAFSVESILEARRLENWEKAERAFNNHYRIQKLNFTSPEEAASRLRKLKIDEAYLVISTVRTDLKMCNSVELNQLVDVGVGEPSPGHFSARKLVTQ